MVEVVKRLDRAEVARFLHVVYGLAGRPLPARAACAHAARVIAALDADGDGTLAPDEFVAVGGVAPGVADCLQVHIPQLLHQSRRRSFMQRSIRARRAEAARAEE